MLAGDADELTRRTADGEQAEHHECGAGAVGGDAERLMRRVDPETAARAVCGNGEDAERHRPPEVGGEPDTVRTGQGAVGSQSTHRRSLYRSGSALLQRLAQFGLREPDVVGGRVRLEPATLGERSCV